MQEQCLIQRQIEGLSLNPTDDCKTEFQLRAGSGRIVMSFDQEERARKESAMRGLTCFRITTIIEQL
jgi:hypothetical protein